MDHKDSSAKEEASSEPKEMKSSPGCCAKDCSCKYRNKYISKWLDDTTVHGIVHVFKSKSPVRRILWSIIFLAAASYCLNNIIDRALHFTSSPTSTTVSIELSDSQVFPTVTICNLNPVKRSFAEPHGLEDLLKLAYQTPVELLFTLSDNSTCHSHLSKVDDITQRMSLQEVFQLGQINLKDFILECRFGERLEDCKNDFEPVLTNIGLCYSFNTKEPFKYARTTGTRAGLYMLVNIDQTEYITSLLGNAGIRIAIHPQGILPEPDQRGIAVPPGKNAYIGLKSDYTNDITKRSKCKYQEPPLKYFPGYQYSITSRHANELVSYERNRCGCLDPISGYFELNERNCTVADLCCLFNSYVSVELTECQPACERWQYETITSYASYPSIDIAEGLAYYFNTSIENFLLNFLAVNIYFEDLSITKSETTNSYSFVALLSDVCGQLGLFVGASVISMLEIGLLIFDIIKDSILNRTCRKKMNQVQKEMQDFVPAVDDIDEFEVSEKETDVAKE